MTNSPSPSVDEVAQAATELLTLLDDFMVVTSITANDRYSQAVERLRASLVSPPKAAGEQLKASCPGCNGTGNQGGNPLYGDCDDCGGTGSVTVSARVVDVPDIKLVIADYLQLRDESCGFDSTDEERAMSANEIHDAVQAINARLANHEARGDGVRVTDAHQPLSSPGESGGGDGPTLVPRPLPPQGLPPAYGGCTCSCHRVPGIIHMVACCSPDRQMTRGWFDRVAALEQGVDVTNAPASPSPVSKAALPPLGDGRAEIVEALKVLRLDASQAEVERLKAALKQVVADYDACSGAEPSLSVLHRSIDLVARAALESSP